MTFVANTQSINNSIPSRVTILSAGLKPLKDYLASLLKPEEQDKIDNINSIQIVEEESLSPNAVQLESEDINGAQRYLLKIGTNVGRNVFEVLQRVKVLGITDEQTLDKSFISEDDKDFKDLLPSEIDSRQILKNVNDILARAYNRRTNMPAWILNLVIKSYVGLNDGYKSVEDILTKDPTFIKVFAKYHSVKKEGGDAEAIKYLDSAFSGDNLEKEKRKLIKISSFVVGFSNKFPSRFIDIFPVVFSLQNIAMPLFARVFKGTLGKVCDFARLVNPWIGDFLAEILGNFKQEINGIQSISGDIKDKKITDKDNGKTLSEIKLTELTHDEYRLQQVVKKVNEGFERLFGKNNTLSSWFLNGILWFSGKEVNYQKFASGFVDNPLFIKRLYAYLKSGAKESFEGTTEEKLIANIVLKVISLAKNMSPSFIENTTNAFGLPYSIQNLTMPILAKFINEGKLSTLIHFLRDVNPIINDLFVDHIGNFRKEITDIQKEPIVSELFPPVIDIEGVKGGVIQSIKSLWQTIRDFGKRVTKYGLEPEGT